MGSQEASGGLPTHIGQYEVVARIASGGMAEVFVARQRGAGGTSWPVAIKRILPHQAADKSFVEMFLDEGRISTLLDPHDNIVRTRDVGQDGQDYFIVMEYVTGVDLRAIREVFARQRRPLPPAMAVFIVSGICAGLDYAHAACGVDDSPLALVHRDISPSNVLVSSLGSVKIIDFGIAKAANRLHQTQGDFRKGKLAYMSPEQATAGALDAASDIFACGTVLYELLTRLNPFAGPSGIDVRRLIDASGVVAPSSCVPSVASELDDICLKALAASPADRYATAGRMQDDLDAYLARDPYSARQLRDWLQRELPEQLELARRRTTAVRHRAGSGAGNTVPVEPDQIVEEPEPQGRTPTGLLPPGRPVAEALPDEPAGWRRVAPLGESRVDDAAATRMLDAPAGTPQIETTLGHATGAQSARASEPTRWRGAGLIALAVLITLAVAAFYLGNGPGDSPGSPEGPGTNEVGGAAAPPPTVVAPPPPGPPDASRSPDRSSSPDAQLPADGPARSPASKQSTEEPTQRPKKRGTAKGSKTGKRRPTKRRRGSGGGKKAPAPPPTADPLKAPKGPTNPPI